MISFSNAKINLGLNILGKRSDGYHNIQSIFLPIDLYDCLEVIKSKKQEFKFYGNKIDCSLKDNLIYKATGFFKKQFKTKGFKFIVHKNIPSKAGLGGGSSNAVFTLKLLSDFFNIDIDKEKIFSMLEKLGSDCPFFIKNKPSLIEGKGEKISEIDIPQLYNKNICIITNNKEICTNKAYSKITEFSKKIDLKNIVLKENILDWKNFLKNDFEKYYLSKYKLLQKTKDILYEKGAIYASMTGSGSAIYGIFEDKKEINLKKTKTIWCNIL